MPARPTRVPRRCSSSANCHIARVAIQTTQTGVVDPGTMRILLALVFAVFACSGPKAKPDSPMVNEGSALPDNCYCKSNPIASSEPSYELINRMECSTKQGACVPD